MEGEAGTVSRVCAHGWGFGRKCGKWIPLDLDTITTTVLT